MKNSTTAKTNWFEPLVLALKTKNMEKISLCVREVLNDFDSRTIENVISFCKKYLEEEDLEALEFAIEIECQCYQNALSQSALFAISFLIDPQNMDEISSLKIKKVLSKFLKPQEEIVLYDNTISVQNLLKLEMLDYRSILINLVEQKQTHLDIDHIKSSNVNMFNLKERLQTKDDPGSIILKVSDINTIDNNDITISQPGKKTKNNKFIKIPEDKDKDKDKVNWGNPTIDTEINLTTCILIGALIKNNQPINNFQSNLKDKNTFENSKQKQDDHNDIENKKTNDKHSKNTENTQIVESVESTEDTCLYDYLILGEGSDEKLGKKMNNYFNKINGLHAVLDPSQPIETISTSISTVESLRIQTRLDSLKAKLGYAPVCHFYHGEDIEGARIVATLSDNFVLDTIDINPIGLDIDLIKDILNECASEIYEYSEYTSMPIVNSFTKH